MPYLRAPLLRALASLAKCLFALTLVLHSFPSKATSQSLYWVPVQEGRVFEWSHPDNLRSILNNEAFFLEEGEILALPARAGDRFLVNGTAAIGLGSGESELPDAIIWHWTVLDQSLEIWVPTWFSGKFLVAKGKHLQVSMATPTSSALSWLRFDQSIARCLLRQKDCFPTPPEGGESLTEYVQEVQKVLEGQPGSKEFIFGLWIQEAMRHRPLQGPYFSNCTSLFDPENTQTKEVCNNTGCATHSHSLVLLESGENYQIEGAQAYRISVRAAGNQRTQLRIFEGEYPVRIVNLLERPGDLQWRAPAQFRAVGPRVRVEIVEGSALVSTVAYCSRHDLLDRRYFRNPDKWFQFAQASGGIPGMLADSYLGRSHESSAKLAQGAENTVGLTRTLLLAEAALANPIKNLSAEQLKEIASADNPFGRRVRAHLFNLGLHFDSMLISEPEDALLAELEAQKSTHRQALISDARRSWSRDVPWRLLPHPPDADTVTLMKGLPSGRKCLPDSRHTIIDRPMSIETTAPGGTHSLVFFHSFNDDSEKIPKLAPEAISDIAPGILTINGVEIPIHPLERPSAVLIQEGIHHFIPSEGLQVRARLPREKPVPCEQLRKLENWTVLSGSQVFELPRPEQATIARIDTLLQNEPVEFYLITENDSFSAWTRPPASGFLEIPVSPDAAKLLIEGDKALVQMRLRLGRQPPDVARQSSISLISRMDEAEREAAETALLHRLRLSTRLVRSGDHKALQQRASLLRQLGFASLAAADQETFDALEGLEEDAWEESDTSSIFLLPTRSPTVIPVGFFAQLPLSISELDADRIMAAFDCEEGTDIECAAELFGDIGLKHSSAVALKRAAEHQYVLAKKYQNVDLAMQAYLSSRLASELGAPNAILSKLSPLVSWQRVSAFERDGGFVRVTNFDQKSDSLSYRVRSAYLDAPEGVQILSEDQRLEARLAGPKNFSIVIELGYESIYQSNSPGGIQLTVNGRITPCEAPNCTLSLEDGAHRIALQPLQHTLGWVRLIDQDGDPIGRSVVSSWSKVQAKHPIEFLVAGPTLARVRARALTKQDTRIAAKQNPLSFEENASNSARPEREHFLVLSNEANEDAEHGTGLFIGRESELLVPIYRNNLVRVLIETTSDSLVQINLAEIQSPPALAQICHQPPSREQQDPCFDNRSSGSGENAGLDQTESNVLTTLDLDAAESPGITSTPRMEADAKTFFNPLAMNPPNIEPPVLEKIHSPGTLGAQISLNLNNLEVYLDEESLAPTRQEARLDYYREIKQEALWFGGHLLGRSQGGRYSLGIASFLDIDAGKWTPSLSLRGRLVTQSYLLGRAFGGETSIECWYRYRFGPSLAFEPRVLLRTFIIEEWAAWDSGIDPEIFSSYREAHPRFVAAGGRLLFSPFMDTRLELGAMSRMLPDFRGIDRIDANLVAQTIGKPSLSSPWIRLDWTASFRPKTHFRDSAFLRQTFGASARLWGWKHNHRLNLTGEVSLCVDTPRNEFLTSAGIRASWNLAGKRGTQDLPPRLILLRERQEEGSPRPRSLSPRSFDEWHAFEWSEEIYGGRE